MNKTIAHITDIHLDEQFTADSGADARKNWAIILNDIGLRQIDEVVFGGDIGNPNSNKWFFDSLNNYNSSLKITPGNHDLCNEIKKYYSNPYLNDRDELYYSYEDSTYKYFFLDSSTGEIGTLQLEWLKKELFNNNKKSIIFIHHPVLKVSTPVDWEFPLINREAIKELFLSYGKEIIIFCGHYHTENESADANIKQYITPSGAFQVPVEADEKEVNADIFGYRLIYIDDESVNTQVTWFDRADF